MRSKDTNLSETNPAFPNLNIHLGNVIMKKNIQTTLTPSTNHIKRTNLVTTQFAQYSRYSEQKLEFDRINY